MYQYLPPPLYTVKAEDLRFLGLSEHISASLWRRQKVSDSSLLPASDAGVLHFHPWIDYQEWQTKDVPYGG